MKNNIFITVVMCGFSFSIQAATNLEWLQMATTYTTVIKGYDTSLTDKVKKQFEQLYETPTGAQEYQDFLKYASGNPSYKNTVPDVSGFINSLPAPVTTPVVTKPVITTPVVTTPVVTKPVVTNPVNVSATADLAKEKNDRMQGDKSTLAQAKTYTDSNVKYLNTQRDGLKTELDAETNQRKTQDVDTLQSAKEYTNNSVKDLNTQHADLKNELNAEASQRKTQDADTLQSAKNYIDNSMTQHANDISAVVNNANKYTDSQINTLESKVEDNQKSAKAYTDQRVNNLRNNVQHYRKEANAGVAGAMAMSQIPQVSPYGRFSLGAGASSFNSEQAISVGFSSRMTSNTVIKAATTADSAKNLGIAVGAGVEW